MNEMLSQEWQIGRTRPKKNVTLCQRQLDITQQVFQIYKMFRVLKYTLLEIFQGLV